MTLEGSGIYVENIFVIIKKILVVIWPNGSYKKGGSKKHTIFWAAGKRALGGLERSDAGILPKFVLMHSNSVCKIHASGEQQSKSF